MNTKQRSWYIIRVFLCLVSYVAAVSLFAGLFYNISPTTGIDGAWSFSFIALTGLLIGLSLKTSHDKKSRFGFGLGMLVLAIVGFSVVRVAFSFSDMNIFNLIGALPFLVLAMKKSRLFTRHSVDESSSS